MNLISQIDEIKSKITGKIHYDENLSKYSWFNLGGPAKVIFKPNTLHELSIFLQKVRGLSKITVLGAGSNILIRDGGYDGIIIKLGKSFSHLSLFDENTIIAGSSCLDRNVSNFAKDKSLSGFEFLSCIPGTIGGGVRMNSGCYGEEISNNLVSLQAMDLDGKMKIIRKEDIKFSYRETNIDADLIFISATFRGKKNNISSVERKIDELVKRKKKDQPSKIKTCGSTFKNPENNKAWRLIKNSGCAELNIGDAYISKQHSNFFVNNGKAKSEHLEKLINIVKDKVFKKTGIKLELELKIIGKNL